MTIVAGDIVAEWDFNYTSGSAVADLTGNGNDLSVTGAEYSWVSDASGGALRFLGTAHTSSATLTNIAANGTIGSSLDGATEWTFVVVVKNTAALNNRPLAGIRSGTSSTDLEFRYYSGPNIASRIMSQQGDLSDLRASTVHGDSISVHIQTIDTTQAEDVDRHQYYKNGLLVTPVTAPTTLPNSNLSAINGTTRKFYLGYDGTSASQADFHHAIIINRRITAQEADDLNSLLTSNNGSIVSVSNPPSVASPPAEIDVTNTTITVGSTATLAGAAEPIQHYIGLWSNSNRPALGDDNGLASIINGDGALFFAGSLAGTTGVQIQHQFTGLLQDTTYVAYVAARNTVTNEGERAAAGNWIKTLPATADVTFLNLTVTNNAGAALSNLSVTPTGETTATLTVDVDASFSGGNLYILTKRPG